MQSEDDGLDQATSVIRGWGGRRPGPSWGGEFGISSRRQAPGDQMQVQGSWYHAACVLPAGLVRLGYTPQSPSVTLILLSPSLRVWAPQILGLAAGACCSRSAHPALHPGLQPRSPPPPKLPCSRVSFLPSIRPSFPLVRTSRPLPLPAPFTLLFSCPKPWREAPLVTQLNNWCAPPTSLSVGDFRDWTQTHTQPLTCTLDIH